MSFIGDIIGGVIGAVTSGIIAIYISQKSLKAERNERYKEKLQDRKDMWLDAHYKELYNDLTNLCNFNERIYKENETQPLQGYAKILETEIVKYKYNSESIRNEVYLKINLDDVKKKIQIYYGTS